MFAASPPLDSFLVKGLKSAIAHLGPGGKFFICLLIGFFILPGLLRVLSFFRRGGSSGV